MKKQIAILGGAFNPPTIGHLKLAQFVLRSDNMFDEVWLTPCASHAYNKKMESFEDRVRMCELISKYDKRIKVFDYELKDNFKSTFHFIENLLKNPIASQYDFSLIIGQDNANNFDKWIEYEKLEKLIRFVVVTRKGEERNIESDWYLKEPHIYLCGVTDIPEMSSTALKVSLHRLRFVRDGLGSLDYEDNLKDVMESTSKDVFEYIDKNGLYKTEE